MKTLQTPVISTQKRFARQFWQGQIFILETAILATPYFQTFYYDGCTAGQKVKSGES